MLFSFELHLGFAHIYFCKLLYHIEQKIGNKKVKTQLM